MVVMPLTLHVKWLPICDKYVVFLLHFFLLFWWSYCTYCCVSVLLSVQVQLLSLTLCRIKVFIISAGLSYLTRLHSTIMPPCQVHLRRSTPPSPDYKQRNSRKTHEQQFSQFRDSHFLSLLYVMPRTRRQPQYPCAVCSTECIRDVVLCLACDRWCHAKCESITRHELRFLHIIHTFH